MVADTRRLTTRCEDRGLTAAAVGHERGVVEDNPVVLVIVILLAIAAMVALIFLTTLSPYL